MPNPDKVQAVDANLSLSLNPIGAWPAISSTHTMLQQAFLLTLFVARFDDEQAEIHAIGQERFELAMVQARHYKAEARMHKALRKRARTEGEAKAAMWRVSQREARMNRRMGLFGMRKRLEMQNMSEEALNGLERQLGESVRVLHVIDGFTRY